MYLLELHRKLQKKLFLLGLKKILCIHTAWERLLVEEWIAPRIFCIHNLIPKYVASFPNDVASMYAGKCLQFVCFFIIVSLFLQAAPHLKSINFEA